MHFSSEMKMQIADQQNNRNSKYEPTDCGSLRDMKRLAHNSKPPHVHRAPSPSALLLTPSLLRALYQTVFQYRFSLPYPRGPLLSSRGQPEKRNCDCGKPVSGNEKPMESVGRICAIERLKLARAVLAGSFRVL